VELLASLHAELSRRVERALGDHLASCEICRGRLESLTAEDASEAGLLSALDLPVPATSAAAVRDRARRRPRVTPLLAAAATLLVVGTAAAVMTRGSALDAWIHRVLTRPPVQTPRPAEHQPSRPVLGGIQVPRANARQIRLTRPQSSGVVRVTFADQDDVSAQARGGEVAYQIHGGELVLDNRVPASRYDITLPLTPPFPTILLVGRTIDPASAGVRWRAGDSIVVDLAAPARPHP